MKKPKLRSAGVSATEHGRAQATIKQLQARIKELEEEELGAAKAEIELLIACAVARSQPRKP